MPLVLRKIRKSRWYKHNKESLPWLPEDDIQADSLADLSTKNNELSAWHIEDGKSNLERIVTALAAKCEHLSNLDYAIFDMQILIENNFKVRKSKGDSADEEANNVWHLDLYEFSAFRLAELAKRILNEGEIKRIQEKTILNLIIKAVTAGQIDRDSLSESISSKIDKLSLS